MELDRECLERAVRATCAPKRRTFGEWIYDNGAWLIAVGWWLLVAWLGVANDVARMQER